MATGGCPAPAPRPPEVRHIPAKPGPRKPADALFGRPDENGRWLRLRDLKFVPRKQFGWRIKLPCRAPVEFTETMTLPAPGDWTFEPAELPETSISRDGKIATTHDYATCLEDGWIEHSWTISEKDPTGMWRIEVSVPGYEPQVWLVNFVR